MGAYMSGLVSDSEEIHKSTDPKSPEWITLHAKATGVSIPEIQRLWVRFQQLGCNNYGVLPSTALTVYDPRAEVDPHVALLQTVLSSLMQQRKGYCTFLSFIHGCSYYEAASVEDKVSVYVNMFEAIFRLMNNGEPVTRDILYRLLLKMYPGQTDEWIQRRCSNLMQAFDPLATGQIAEDQLRDVVMRLPEPRREQLFQFGIVPAYVSSGHLDRGLLVHGGPGIASQGLSGPGGIAPPAPSGDNTLWRFPPQTHRASYTIPSDEQLVAVAAQLRNVADMYRLGNRLGFFESDLERVEAQHQASRSQQAYALLKAWRLREGLEAYVIKLQKALQDVGLPELATGLNNPQ